MTVSPYPGGLAGYVSRISGDQTIFIATRPESGKRIVVTATSTCSFLKENDPVHLSISGSIVAISSSPGSLTCSLRVVDVAEVP